jgi:CO/xanthine dehydrogenase Mo-binding subunit
MDELAAAAKQDAVAYRRALLDKAPRAKAVLELAAAKAGWGQPLPQGVGRGDNPAVRAVSWIGLGPPAWARRLLPG